MVPPNVDTIEQRYIEKADYGKVPEYLSDVKAAIEEEKTMMREILSEQKTEDEDEPKLRVMTQEEKEELLYKLKLKWDSVNKEFQNMAHLVQLDTMNKRKKKENMEKTLEAIEKMVKKLTSAAEIVIK